MDEKFSKEECNRTVDRLHTRIDKSEKDNISMKDSVSSIEKNVALLCQRVDIFIEDNSLISKLHQEFNSKINLALFGEDGRGGMSKESSRMATSLAVQWWFIGIMTTSLIGSAIWIIVKIPLH